MNNIDLRSRRLLDAFDYIDETLIAEVTDKYMKHDIPGKSVASGGAKMKFYTKIIALAACVVMLMGVMTYLPHLITNIINSGPSEQPEPDPEAEYYNNHHNPEWEYYGRYGNCYASLPKGENASASSETVGEYTFEYSTDTSMKVFFDDGFFSLKEAYDKGYITESELGDLYLHHSEIVGKTQSLDLNFRTIPVSLYEYEVRRILYGYFMKYNWAERNVYPGSAWSVDCLYRGNGVYAVFVDWKEQGFYWAEEKCEINGKIFIYPSVSRVLKIYYDGDIYTVEEAFEEKILTEEMLNELHESFTENYDLSVRGGYRYD